MLWEIDLQGGRKRDLTVAVTVSVASLMFLTEIIFSSETKEKQKLYLNISKKYDKI